MYKKFVPEQNLSSKVDMYIITNSIEKFVLAVCPLNRAKPSGKPCDTLASSKHFWNAKSESYDDPHTSSARLEPP